MNKKLLSKTLQELKDLCREKKIKGYSKLNKEELIKLLKKKKGGSSINPLINIYIYNVVNYSEGESNENGYTYYSSLTKQKFNNFYIASNNKGIIQPSSYVIANRTRERKPNKIIEFNISKIAFDGRIYNFDPLTTIKQNGGYINKFYNFYKNKLTKVNTFENSGRIFYTDNIISDVYITINNAHLKIKDYLVSNTNQSSSTNNNSNNNNNHNTELSDKLAGAYIFNINIIEGERVIIFGDLHGSYHAFFRIFMRLHILGVIDFPNYIINNNYRLIFLGDILDRGQYALEILYILSKFIVNNPVTKIMINRGNHENIDMWYNEEQGFIKELKEKFKKNNNIFGLTAYYEILIKNFFSNCSSAIILNYGEKKYWLCHGGFPLGKKEDDDIFIVPSDPITFYPLIDKNHDSLEISKQIRWSDFCREKKSNHSGNSTGGRSQIGLDKLKKFLFLNKIDFIIRGHSDDFENAFLLVNGNNSRNKKERYTLALNQENIYDINPENRIISNNSKNIIFPTEDSIIEKFRNIRQTDLPLAQIRTNNWLVEEGIKQKRIETNISLFNTSGEEEEVYPVLTISTNSDVGRTLNKDSFICFNFSDGPDFPSKNLGSGIELLNLINPRNN